MAEKELTDEQQLADERFNSIWLELNILRGKIEELKRHPRSVPDPSSPPAQQEADLLVRLENRIKSQEAFIGTLKVENDSLREHKLKLWKENEFLRDFTRQTLDLVVEFAEKMQKLETGRLSSKG
jgi:hypothetical protein